MSLPTAIPRGVLVEVRTGSVYDADGYLFGSKGPDGHVYWQVYWDPDKTGEHYLNREAARSGRLRLLNQGYGIHGTTMPVVAEATNFVRARCSGFRQCLRRVRIDERSPVPFGRKYLTRPCAVKYILRLTQADPKRFVGFVRRFACTCSPEQVFSIG